MLYLDYPPKKLTINSAIFKFNGEYQLLKLGLFLPKQYQMLIEIPNTTSSQKQKDFI